ncbi:MAG: transcriptional regulator [Clostridium sp.]|nr:transcriptional regulator [Clostridium sp.]
MKKEMLGSLVSYERNRKEISLQMLASGISSPSAIQRLEAGERMPDYFVLERILERLGKSLNKIEFLYDEKVYEIHYLRGLIECYLEESDYAEVLDALAYYESIPEGQDSLHKQYIYKIKGIVQSKQKNHREAALMYELALAETVPDFELGKMESFLLGEEELNLVILWMNEVWIQKDVNLKLNPEKPFYYIEKYCEDEEIKINIYTKAAWLIGTYYMEQGEYREALRYTLKGQDVLAENGILLHMPEFLERILILTKLCEDSSYDIWKRQRDALKSLYEEYKKDWAKETIALWKSFRQQELYLYSEVFAQERKRRNLSQEKLADALEIDQKTISRIESGKYKPKTGTLQKLREYLEIERDVCTTRIVVDDFELLEMERTIAKLINRGQINEAEELYKDLRIKLSTKWKENLQYVIYMDALLESVFKRISYEETIQRCVEAFNVTRDGVKLEDLEDITLSRLETFVLSYIANCYRRIGRSDISICILESLAKSYEKSKVDLKYRVVAVALIYTALGDTY